MYANYFSTGRRRRKKTGKGINGCVSPDRCRAEAWPTPLSPSRRDGGDGPTTRVVALSVVIRRPELSETRRRPPRVRGAPVLVWAARLRHWRARRQLRGRLAVTRLLRSPWTISREEPRSILSFWVWDRGAPQGSTLGSGLCFSYSIGWPSSQLLFVQTPLLPKVVFSRGSPGP